MTTTTAITKQSAWSLYRKLYRRTQLISQYDKQQKTLIDIRTAFNQIWPQLNENSNESNNDKNEFMEKMKSRLTFIEMTTPKMTNLAAIRHIHDKNATPIDYSNHGTRSLFFKGESGEIIDVNKQVQEQKEQDVQLTSKKDKAAVSNWTYGNIDPDHIKKHEQLLRRQQFMEGPLKDYPKNVHGIDQW